MIRYRFSKEINQDFSKSLKSRVNSYFKDNGISPRANSTMVIKSLVATVLYFSIYFIILFSGITNLTFIFGLWMLLGAAQAFIGTSVMHDVLHGSLTKNKLLNFGLQIPVIAIGVEPTIWKLQHNVLHHTYTNIEHADEDIASRYVLRMTENQPRRWFHKYQHYYVTFLYSLLTIIWMTAKDFIKLGKYYKTGLVSSKKEAFKTLLNIILHRAIFYFTFLVLPIYVLDFPPLLVVAMFVSMLMVSGVVLSIIFQLAHVVEDCVTLDQDEEKINENWSVHQLMTTSNFAVDNKIITYLFGGLNYQVEHHLFPNICHVHYPAISKIVKATAQEYGIPYHCQNTFGSALKSHYAQLKELGRSDSLPVTSTLIYT